MTEGKGSTREERMTARLRDNLRRRKDQARALTATASTAESAEKHASPAPESGGPLSKQGPNG